MFKLKFKFQDASGNGLNNATAWSQFFSSRLQLVSASVYGGRGRVVLVGKGKVPKTESPEPVPTTGRFYCTYESIH